MGTVYYLMMFGWFVYGITLVYKLAVTCPRGWINNTIIDPAYYDAVTLKVVMIAILAVYWIMMILFVQLIILILCIRSCWVGIKEAAANMIDNNFDIKIFILEMNKALGDGEWQDSVLIGLVQWLLSDDNFQCKICKESLRPAAQSENETNQAPSNGNPVWLKCNITHVFHDKCIAGLSHCPECREPIQIQTEVSSHAETPIICKYNSDDDAK